MACFQLYKMALGNCFEVEDWGPIEFSIMAKHFERQGNSPYAYHSVSYAVLMVDSSFCVCFVSLFYVSWTLLIPISCKSSMGTSKLSRPSPFLFFYFSSFFIFCFHVFVAIHGSPSLSWTTWWKWLKTTITYFKS